MTLCANLVLLFQPLVFILLGFCSESYTCTDTITATQFIKDPQTLLSNGTNFKLGFFSPANTTNRYVGILYNIPPTTAVWVANRDKPLNDSFGTVTISKDGNLVVLNRQKQIVWSSNVSDSTSNSSARLLDTGNLVLVDNNNGRTLWESFENPSDSFLQKMKISTSGNEAEIDLLTSWKSPSDPSIGRFSSGLDPQNIPQVFVWDNGKPYWRSGPWNGQTFIGVPSLDSVYLNGFSLVDDREGSVTLLYNYANDSTIIYIELDSEGDLIEKYWNHEVQDWEIGWSALEDECDVYGKCGPFGSCTYSQDLPICSCLKGFEQKDIGEWERGNWSGGCVRMRELKCERNGTVGEEGKEDGFLKLTTMKVPDFAEWSDAVEENCGKECFRNCSCLAYSFYSGIGCMQWSGTLIDTNKFLKSGGVDLYIRVAYSELSNMQLLSLSRCIYLSLEHAFNIDCKLS